MTGIRVAIFGASGMAGSQVLRVCVADDRVAQIISVGRKPLAVSSPKLQEIVHNDFTDLGPISDRLADLDAVFWLLGVSQMKVREEAEYRQITYGFTMEAARVVVDRSPRAVFHFLSGAGTKTGGRAMWQRIKGETEDALVASELHRVVCYRLSMLVPSSRRKKRSMLERVAGLFGGLFLLSRSAAITGEQFGNAFLAAQFTETPNILTTRMMRDLADGSRG